MTSTSAPPRTDAAKAAADRSSSAAVVDLRGITLHYGDHVVLNAFDLQVNRGELIALLGPSGSGKTTVIRTVSGFLQPTYGSVFLNGEDVTDRPAHKRGVGVVFQSYALFPHMTVADNIAYPLKIRGAGKSEIKSRVAELLELVQLGNQGKKKPARLSGGQQQRVALARALAMSPDVLLLDEPLSNLDANLRREVGEEIRRLQKKTGTTAIMVTHDRQEAFGMADRIAVLRAGKIEQLGPPRELYRNPKTRFMAQFVGEANLVRGEVVDRRADTGAEQAGLTVKTAIGQIQCRGVARVGETVDVLIRPEDLMITGAHEQSLNRITGSLEESFYYGNSLIGTVDASGQHLTLMSSGSSVTVPGRGEPVTVTVSPNNCLALSIEAD
ncbi:MAG: ABC transporter ATP-binding protein [Comamonadaceae bacterium]|nr:MAG: ABC transporter ATP-binding protein [Comamonadaceae bacterium]